jgi:cation transport ATPase
MKAIFAAWLVFLAAHAGAATPAKVKRGDLEVKIKVTGTVVADDIFRIKSSIEGRVESVLTSTYVWRGADQPLAFLAHKELAAMLDSKDMDSLIAIGTSTAYAFSAFNLFRDILNTGGMLGEHPDLYFEVASLLITFVLLGKWLEVRARGQTSSAIEKLMAKP